MIEDLIDKFQKKLTFAPEFKKTVAFVIQDQDNRQIIFDCSERPAALLATDDGADADVTLIADLNIFEGIMDGSRDPNMAFMTRKLKIKGSMGVAMRLNAILED